MKLFASSSLQQVRLGLCALGLFCLTSKLHAATFAVDTTSDDDLAACTATPNDCSLRGAINKANAAAGADAIAFAIPGAGIKTIAPTTQLPPLQDAITIDGYTQPNAAPNTLPKGSNARLLVEISGELDSSLQNDGFTVLAPNCNIRGLVLNRCYSAISIGQGAQNVKVQGCFIGTNATGLKAAPNARGITLRDNAQDITIGGHTPEARNVISGNTIEGILANEGIFIGNRATRVIIQGNYIGTDKTGEKSLPNLQGIATENETHDIIIGGNRINEGNLISGNSVNGVAIYNSFRCAVSGNLIGITPTDKPLGNGADYGGAGVAIYDSSIRVGGSPQQRNVIAANKGAGIFISISTTSIAPSTIQSNFIGTNSSGDTAIPNNLGIYINGANTVQIIGGAGEGQGNIISGNHLQGILLENARAIISGNRIGTNYESVALPNGKEGISLQTGSFGTTIGGSTLGSANFIASNNGAGICIDDSFGNRVQGNFIGTDPSGTVAQGNKIGIELKNGATHNLIGGANGALRNLISGNEINGILVTGVFTDNNFIQGNYIGTDRTGTQILQNIGSGIEISDGASETVIGGSTTATRNLISGNRLAGITIRGRGGNTPVKSDTKNNLVQGNLIGTDLSGSRALRNVVHGIFIDNAPRNSIGGATAGTRNVISGNLQNGIRISGDNAHNNLVRGNFIGTDARGTSAIPNTGEGIAIYSVNNVVGGPTARPGTGAGNVISGNAKAGILISAPRSDANSSTQILGNLIGTNFTGTAAVSNEIGVQLQSSLNTIIGNSRPSGRNIISGNLSYGIAIGFPSISFNTRVQGNYIGTDISGSKSIANVSGIAIYGGIKTIIGGATTRPGSGSGNVISGNKNNGILFNNPGFAGPFQPGSQCAVLGNAIGVGADALTSIPNQATGNEPYTEGAGIFNSDFPDVTIGAPGQFANIIAHNEGTGINVKGFRSAFRICVQANQIFDNGLLGIDLNGDGVTLNDAGDEDYGANYLQNFPVINSATQTSPDEPLLLQGTLDSFHNSRYTIDVYANSVADPSGFGEGEIYLGSFDVTTQEGVLIFSHSLATNLDLTGKFITTTATLLSTKSTSEFSQAIEVNAASNAANGVAYSSNSSVVLTFDTKLQSAGTVNVKVNGQNVKEQSVEVKNQNLTILLPDNALKTGDKIAVSWRDLQTQSGAKLTGNAPPIIAE